jgi:hypothetical protein
VDAKTREGVLVEVFPHAPPLRFPHTGFVLDGHQGRLAA